MQGTMETKTPKKRNGLSRGTYRTHLVPQERDARFFSYALHLPFLPTPAATVLLCSDTGEGTRAATERIMEYHRAGYITRLRWERSSLLAGGALPDLLVVENGLAGVTVDAKHRLEELPPEERRAWELLANADRQRALTMLDLADVDLQEAGILMRNHGETARALINRTRNADHQTLTATLAAILIFNARMNGWTVDTILEDGRVHLTAIVESGGKKRKVTRRPDLTLVLADSEGADCYLLEAETGQASSAKVRDKVLQYQRLIEAAGGTDGFKSFVQSCAGTDTLRSVRIVFYCQTDEHLDAVSRAMGAVLDPGRYGSFTLINASKVNLDVPSLALRNNAQDASGVRVLDRYKTLLQGNVAGTPIVVEERISDDGRPPEVNRHVTVDWGPFVKVAAGARQVAVQPDASSSQHQDDDLAAMAR